MKIGKTSITHVPGSAAPIREMTRRAKPIANRIAGSRDCPTPGVAAAMFISDVVS